MFTYDIASLDTNYSSDVNPLHLSRKHQCYHCAVPFTDYNFLCHLIEAQSKIPFILKFHLGETFRCHWKTDDFCGSQSDPASYPSPPRPWIQSENIEPNDLTFIAEQVSL